MNQCYFCSQNIEEVDYKDAGLLRKFISGQGKIVKPKYNNTCATHQRRVSMAIKRARFMALLPFVRR